MNGPLERMLNEQVVLDTATPIVYIGTLDQVTDQVFVLKDADMHDCRDGHANKDFYLVQTARMTEEKPAVNRREVVVMRSVVISVSRLADIVTE